MKIISSTAFERDLRRYLRKTHESGDEVSSTLRMLSRDPFSAKLKTHRLKGPLKDYWACSGGYDLRIIFEFTKFEDEEIILLHSLGSHDDVY